MAADLLSLPPEIRVRIITHVFKDTIITIHALKDAQDGPPGYDWNEESRRLLSTQVLFELERVQIGRSKTALLRLNRQIRQEALPLFFPNVIVNLHVGATLWTTQKTKNEVARLFNAMFKSVSSVASKIERLAFFIESTELFKSRMDSFESLREVYAWDWKSLCSSEIEYFSEVGCGSTRHEEYNQRMAEFLFDRLKLNTRLCKTYFQHSVCDTKDDILEIGGQKGHFTHQVVPSRDAIIPLEHMDVDNLTAYPLR